MPELEQQTPSQTPRGNRALVFYSLLSPYCKSVFDVLASMSCSEACPLLLEDAKQPEEHFNGWGGMFH